MIRVAFQGERGAYSEIAAQKYFNNEIKLFPSFTIDDVFTRVKKGEVNFGIVPIENTLYGSIFETYDLLSKYSFSIAGECSLKINHYLLADKKYKLKELKKIYSHPQALGQCSDFIKKNRYIQILPAYDTAGSALIALNSKHEPTGAIASKEAAKLYKLKILKEKIQNKGENLTRFLIISKRKTKRNFVKPKTSISFELKSIPGALFKALSVFALRDIDLLKIESRPIPHKPFQYLFYADLAGKLNEQKIKHALQHLSEISLNIRTFGTYESGKTFAS